MPVFRYVCACGREGDVLVPNYDDTVGCECGDTMARQFSPTTNLRLAPWMTREAEDSRAAHRAYMETPEVQAKLKSGEFDIDTSDRYTESGNGVGASSSILTRLEAGLPLA